MIKAKTKSKVLIDPDELAAWKLPEKSPSLLVMERLVLPSKSNVYTSLDISLTPYLKMPIELLGDSRAFLIGLIMGTQAGKSTYLQVAIADMIDQQPGTALYVLPDRASGQKQLKDKVIDPIKLTPTLARHIIQPAARSMTQDIIRLDHMTINLGWSNSPASLSSTPCSRVFLDEVRLFKKELGNESNPVKLATDRLTVARSAGLAQMYLVSTPSDEGDLLYQQLQVDNTTVLWWYNKCQHCGKYQILDFFTNVKEIDGEVRCRCKYCKGDFSDLGMKRDMNKHAGYAPEGQDGTTRLQIGKLTERIFFRTNSMTSPFRPFAMIYKEYIETKKHINDYKNFIQCWLAQFWKIGTDLLSSDDLLGRQADYERRIVPDWCKVITAGIDTQDDGFFVAIRAWGSDRKTHLIDNFEIAVRMDEMPAFKLADLFRKQVEERVYKQEDGTPWQVAQYAIDTGGHRTPEVYALCDELQNMILVKGRDTQVELIISSKKVFGLYTVRTGDYLAETQIACRKAYWTLYKNTDPEFLEQWVSTVKTLSEPSKTTGLKKLYWKKIKQNDYRYADVHSYIAMDIPFDDSTLRRNLEDANWSYNPKSDRLIVEADEAINNGLEIRSEPSNPYAPSETFSNDFNFSFS